MRGSHLHDVERLDVVEALVEVPLHRLRVLGLAEDLEQVVVAEEVEAREDLPLRLEVHVERLLDLLQFGVHVVELFQSPCVKRKNRINSEIQTYRADIQYAYMCVNGLTFKRTTTCTWFLMHKNSTEY